VMVAMAVSSSAISLLRCCQRQAADRSDSLHASLGFELAAGRSREQILMVSLRLTWLRSARRPPGAVISKARSRLEV
jgi:hypothetical protein